MTDKAIETPSGKTAKDENFPVGSWLLPRDLRPAVAGYYDFARAIDDIADNPNLTPVEKVRRLDLFAAAIEGKERDKPGLEKAHHLRRILERRVINKACATDLVKAFLQDVVKTRYNDWEELIGYCRYSANPVGHFLLDIHGEDKSGYATSDALCTALQILNHLQDCQDDFRNLDRVYIPEPWFHEEGFGVEVLDEDKSPPGLRAIFDRCLDEVDLLLEPASALPQRLSSRSLAMESAVILRLARRLSQLLREGDPLAERVALERRDFIRCGWKGAKGEFLRRLVADGRALPASVWQRVRG